jgi:hypothetical protein
LLTNRDEISNLYRRPSKDASYQVWVHLPKLSGSIYGRSSVKIANFVPIHKQTWPPKTVLVSDWSIFKNICLLTDQDKISNLYRVPSIYVSYKVLVHLAKQFQRRRFSELDQSETSIA